jgi:hypothetical protein
MKEELEKKLFEEFPEIYHPEKPETEILMCYGFMCGNGWFDIIYKLSKDIYSMNRPDNFEVFEVKEKFGGLRFYVENGTEEIHNRIHEAEEESYKTCEFCGKPGEVRKNKGWLQTLCLDCFVDINR